MRPPPAAPVYCLAGPTGVGKSALALALAERLDAEIIGADAFQIYDRLPILTAQPSVADRARVPHHLVGSIPLPTRYDAQRYATDARAVLDALAERGRTALVVGGTGLYFRALFDGFAATPAADPALRAELEAVPLPDLVERLRRADPAAPSLVDVQNPRRVIRAIEIVETSGRPLAEFRQTPRGPWPAGLLLGRDREELRRRIAQNVAAMFASGVVEEVRAAAGKLAQISPPPPATAAIGFREITAHLRGELDLAACESAIVTTTQQYAKRQLTWFRRQTTFRPLDLTATSHLSQAAESALQALDFS